MNKMCFFLFSVNTKLHCWARISRTSIKDVLSKAKINQYVQHVLVPLNAGMLPLKKNDEHNSTFLFCSLATWGVNGYFSKADFAF